MSPQESRKPLARFLKNLDKATLNRMLGSCLILGILMTLPEPVWGLWDVPNLLLVFSWILLLLNAILIIFAVEFFIPIYSITWFILLLLSLKASFYFPLVMMSLWGLWYYFRNQRSSS